MRHITPNRNTQQCSCVQGFPAGSCKQELLANDGPLPGVIEGVSASAPPWMLLLDCTFPSVRFFLSVLHLQCEFCEAPRALGDKPCEGSGSWCRQIPLLGGGHAWVVRGHFWPVPYFHSRVLPLSHPVS